MNVTAEMENASTFTPGASVHVVSKLSAAEFASCYVATGRPVLIKGALAGTAAFKNWTFDDLRQQSGEKTTTLKDWDQDGEMLTRVTRVASYLDEIKQYEALRAAEKVQKKRPAYLHDVPLTSIFPDAAADLASFPSEFFPAWYGANWTDFAQFFLGPSMSVTPLHFDCLLTHNLFFQLHGRKRFTVLDHSDIGNCYVHDWRWSAVDPEAPDLHKHPRYQQAAPQQIVVERGDVFYMPPGTLHHVRSLDAAMSFNVDWHTRESALKGVFAAKRGMPLKNVYYNAIVALGLWTGLSNRRLMPFYRSYLSYVS